MDKRALQNISYGLYLICSKFEGKENGQIANAVFQVTSEPPTLAISINKNNFTHELIKKSKKFTLSVLGKNTPMKFIGTFGFKCGREINKMNDVNCILSKTNIPIIIDYSIAFIVVNVTHSLNIGTHTIFVGDITDAEMLKQEDPMTYDYYRNVKGGFSPKSAPTYVNNKSEKEEKINQEKKNMEKYVCTVCGYIYDPVKGDPDGGIAPGTPFDEIPDDWVCPVCGAGKDAFEKQ